MTNKKRKRHNKNDASNKNQKSPTNKEQRITSPSTIKRTKSNESSSLLEKMRARLSGGHFRMINEKLYTCTGKEALHYFREDSSLFNLYHEGYKTQMSNWPEKPVNVIIKWLKKQTPESIPLENRTNLFQFFLSSHGTLLNWLLRRKTSLVPN